MTENKRKELKIVTIAVVAGLVGGGVTLGGTYLLNEYTNVGTLIAGTGEKVSVNQSNVEGKSQATQAFNKVSGAVVSVINQQAATNSSILGQSQSASSSTGGLTTASEGSGVIYKKNNGKAYIVTNNHVVAGASALQVLLSDGTKLTASLVGKDAYTDLAVLSVDADKVSTLASFVNSDDIQPGESVLAIGSPLGTEYATSVTEGIISATQRTVKATDEQGNSLGNETVIQTDAAINPGNSGGPLVNLAGQVVGINSKKLASSQDGTSVEGMGFAIPANTVVKIINELEKSGSITRPGLGISMLDLSSVSAADQKNILKLSSDVTSGVVVMDVTSDSPAGSAGLKQYDVITKFGDETVGSAADLRTELFSHKVGDTVEVTYYRDGKSQKTTLKLTKTSDQASNSEN